MYYIYGHFLDNVCIYIGSNCMSMDENRAYDLSNRNRDYAKITKNRKQDIKVRLLRTFTEKEINSGISVQSEEMKMIAKYHDKGEALCSHQDARGRHHSIETKRKMSMNHVDVRGKNNPMYGKCWNKGINLSKEYRDKISNGLIEKYKNNPEIKNKISKANSGKNNGRANKCMLEHNNIKINFDTLSDLFNYCKNKYNIGGSVFKKLLDTQQPYTPRCKRHEKARGLILRKF